MFDPKKLKNFAKPSIAYATSGPMGPYDDPIIQEAMARDAELDDPMNLEAAAMQHRLLEPKVGYQESVEKAGAFSCGNCRYSMDGGFCAFPTIMAYINEKNGCCNNFTAEEDNSLVDPDQWACMESDEDEEKPAAEGEGEGEEDGDGEAGEGEDGDESGDTGAED